MKKQYHNVSTAKLIYKDIYKDDNTPEMPLACFSTFTGEVPLPESSDMAKNLKIAIDYTQDMPYTGENEIHFHILSRDKFNHVFNQFVSDDYPMVIVLKRGHVKEANVISFDPYAWGGSPMLSSIFRKSGLEAPEEMVNYLYNFRIAFEKY